MAGPIFDNTAIAKKMRLYHRTTWENARQILRTGFVDGTGNYLTERQFSGVWLSNVPLDINEGASGDTLLAIDVRLTKAQLDEFEWVEEGNLIGNGLCLPPDSMLWRRCQSCPTNPDSLKRDVCRRPEQRLLLTLSGNCILRLRPYSRVGNVRSRPLTFSCCSTRRRWETTSGRLISLCFSPSGSGSQLLPQLHICLRKIGDRAVYDVSDKPSETVRS